MSSKAEYQELLVNIGKISRRRKFSKPLALAVTDAVIISFVSALFLGVVLAVVVARATGPSEKRHPGGLDDDLPKTVSQSTADATDEH